MCTTVGNPGCKLLRPYGPKFAPVVFMSIHVMMFVVSSIFAMVGYHYYYVHTGMLVMWITVSIWNGANFYMEWFAKKYEANLKRLE